MAGLTGGGRLATLRFARRVPPPRRSAPPGQETGLAWVYKRGRGTVELAGDWLCYPRDIRQEYPAA